MNMMEQMRTYIISEMKFKISLDILIKVQYNKDKLRENKQNRKGE